VRTRRPLVPVILMTSEGSEEIAVQALRRGAASYVPKRRLAQDILATVRGVLGVAGQQRGRARLLGHLSQSNCAFELPNDCTLFEPLIGYLQESITQLGICDESDYTRISIALAEALSNAAFHGNLEIPSALRGDDEDAYCRMIDERLQKRPYCERRIHVVATMSREEARFVVRDEGPGFDPQSLPDPTDPANLEKLSGRGVLLMRSFMDELTYSPRGNEVTLVKRCNNTRS
ncbi:MAG: ATP-binding protein, partial [Planctomycetota bacterium]